MERKDKINVLILEAGGPCGVACIKILRKHKGINVIAADMSPYASGLALADEGVIIPGASDKNFTKEIVDLIDSKGVEMILPTFEHGFDLLEKIDAPFITDFKAARLCKDKFAFVNACKESSVPVPKTAKMESANSLKFPLYLKPRYGVGSRNNHILHNNNDLKAVKLLYRSSIDEFIVQELLQGKHWNIDVMVRDGICEAALPREDLKLKDGNCITVRVQNNKNLIHFAYFVGKKLNIQSPFNLEVFEVKRNNYVINEINVRFGGGIIFSALAGVDMVSYLVTGNKTYLGEIKEGVYTRYYEEVKVNI